HRKFVRPRIARIRFVRGQITDPAIAGAAKGAMTWSLHDAVALDRGKQPIADRARLVSSGCPGYESVPLGEAKAAGYTALGLRAACRKRDQGGCHKGHPKICESCHAMSQFCVAIRLAGRRFGPRARTNRKFPVTAGKLRRQS